MAHPSTQLPPLGTSCPFLSLPFDLLLTIVDKLSFRDLIALSLTTKGLRYLCPKLPTKAADARCFWKIHKKFLSQLPAQIPQTRRSKRRYTNSTGRRKCRSGQDECPYCEHPICPPTCQTALILDSMSGHFIPRNLFPTHIARFKYPEGSNNQHKNTDLSSTMYKVRVGSQTRPPGVRLYSTIWCEHHRCPRDMFSQKKYFDIGNGLGPELFLREYSGWKSEGQLRDEKNLGYWVNDRWKIGHRLPPEATNLADVAEEDLIPIYEKFFYDAICLHCFSRLPSKVGSNIFDQPGFLSYRCSCHKDKSKPRLQRRSRCCYYYGYVPRKDKGCLNCGYVSVKFTRIEVFDFVDVKADGYAREGFWLSFATECNLRPVDPDCGYRGDERLRISPIDPVLDKALLEIVRGNGYGLIPSKQLRAGIQDMPYGVLRKILNYLVSDTEADSSRSLASALEASYCFIKAWYREGAPGKAKGHLQEPYNIIEAS